MRKHFNGCCVEDIIHWMAREISDEEANEDHKIILCLFPNQWQAPGTPLTSPTHLQVASILLYIINLINLSLIGKAD